MFDPSPERVHFLDDQRRNRRRSLRFGVFAITAVAIAGLPLCVVIAPLLLGGALIIAHVIDLFAPLGASAWATLHDAIFVGPTIWRKLHGQDTAISWGALAFLYMAPGTALMLVAWPFVRLLSRRAGAGSLLHRLDSRAPDAARLEEQQLLNVVAEMSVAAGVPTPAVRVIDSPKVNAVAIGLTVDDATVLVTSGFLERMDRDERQAVVAHLVGSVGNGDLEIASTIFSVFETWALVTALLEAPMSAPRRAFVRRFARRAYQEARGHADEGESREIITTLLVGGAQDLEDFISKLENLEPESAREGCFLILFRMPLMVVFALAMLTAREATNLFTLLALGPWLAAMWRARRRLADATAVQLTRNPTALAGAIRTFAASDVEVPGGWPVYFLFPVWVPMTEQPAAEFAVPSTNIVGMRLEPEPRLRHLTTLGAAYENGAAPVTFAKRIKAALPQWRDLRTALGWGIVVIVLIAVLLVVTVLAASLLVILLWYVLRWVLTWIGIGSDAARS